MQTTHHRRPGHTTHTETSDVRPGGGGSPRTAAAAFVVAGVAFAAYPALRPYTDETTLAGAAAMASGAWTVSHVLAMVGFAMAVVGLVGFAERGRSARVAAWAAGAGTALVLPYYGAETFGLGALGAAAVARGDAGLLAVADAVRYAPVPAVGFAAGLLLLAAAGVATARAAGWSAAPFAVGLVLFGPVFLAPPAGRVAHGLLLAVGCLLLARSSLGASRA